MTAEQRAAAVSRTEAEIADRFQAYGLADPAEKATALVRWLQRNGWRVHVDLADTPPLSLPRQADPTVQADAMRKIREDLEAARKRRQEAGR